jgi:hypothetical protein
MGADSHERRKKQKVPRHIRLYHWMLNSPAWQSLSPIARCLYIEMASRYAGVDSNNGRIPYSVREGAEALVIGKATAHKALGDLVERGFIVPIKAGVFTLKRATEWRLTEFACDVTNAAATKDFMRWEPSEIQNKVPVAELTVPVAERDRTCSRTVVAKMSRISTSSRTENAPNSDSQFGVRYTTSMPGTSASASVSPLSASPQLVAAIARKDSKRALRPLNRAQASTAVRRRGNE